MAFERAIKSDYSPQTAIEGQLVTRLASLLWRLRRAVIVESGLLNIQAGIIRDQTAARANIEHNTDRLSIFRRFLRPIDQTSKHQGAWGDIGVDPIHLDKPETNQTYANTARAFLRLTKLDERV